jgi:cell fate (sporulation/competence/biofilm development) regulator YlbF (YheA/YmcA/DUF963 family)
MRIETTATTPAVEAAQALADALRHTEVIQAYLVAERRFQTDPDVGRVREGLLAAYQAYEQAERAGTATIEHIQEVRRRQQALQAHPTVGEYARAREAGGLFLQRVNEEISSLLGIDFGATAGPAGGAC